MATIGCTNERWVEDRISKKSPHELLGALVGRLTAAEAHMLCSTIANRLPSTVAQAILRDALNRERIANDPRRAPEEER